MEAAEMKATISAMTIGSLSFGVASVKAQRTT